VEVAAKNITKVTINQRCCSMSGGIAACMASSAKFGSGGKKRTKVNTSTGGASK